VNCWIAVEEESDGVFREPRSFPCDFEGDSEDGGVLVFHAYAGEVVWCEATMDVLTNVFCCEVVCLKLMYAVYCFV